MMLTIMSVATLFGLAMVATRGRSTGPNSRPVSGFRTSRGVVTAVWSKTARTDGHGGVYFQHLDSVTGRPCGSPVAEHIVEQYWPEVMHKARGGHPTIPIDRHDGLPSTTAPPNPEYYRLCQIDPPTPKVFER